MKLNLGSIWGIYFFASLLAWAKFKLGRLLPTPYKVFLSGGGQVILPCGGSSYGPSCLLQNTPAVAGGLVALHRPVEASGTAVRDEGVLLGDVPSVAQSALPLLVTGGNLIWNQKGRTRGSDGWKQNRDMKKNREAVQKWKPKVCLRLCSKWRSLFTRRLLILTQSSFGITPSLKHPPYLHPHPFRPYFCLQTNPKELQVQLVTMAIKSVFTPRRRPSFTLHGKVPRVWATVEQTSS